MLHVENMYWQLADDSIWGTREADFVEADMARTWAQEQGLAGIPPSPPDAAGQLSREGVREALLYYGLPLGALMPLEDARSAKRAEIMDRFDKAVTASLTMPSVSATPSTYEVAIALYDWRAQDPEGYAALVDIHAARRDELLAAVGAAKTTAEVRAVAVSYAV